MVVPTNEKRFNEKRMATGEVSPKGRAPELSQLPRIKGPADKMNLTSAPELSQLPRIKGP